MSVTIYPQASTNLSAFGIDVPVANTATWGDVTGSAGTYEVTFFPALGGTPSVSIGFLDASNASIGGAVLIDPDTSSTSNQVYGRAVVTGDIASVSVHSTIGGWALIRQLQSATNLKRVFKLTSSGTATLLSSARVLAIGGGGGGGPVRFNGGNGGGGGGSGYYSVGTLAAGSYGYTIGGGGAAGNGDSTKSGDGGSTSISTITAAGGQGGYNGYYGATGGAGGSGGAGGTNNQFFVAFGGTNGSNGETPVSGGAGGVGSGVAPEGWTGNAPQLQAGFGAAGAFAQGGAGGVIGTGDAFSVSGVPSTGGGGGGASRQFGSNINGSNGGSGAIYYYYL